MRFRLKFIGAKTAAKGGLDAYAAERWLPVSFTIFPTAGETEVTLYIKPRATLLTLAALALAAYLGAGFGLAWWFNRAPHNRIRLADVMLPWHWPRLRSLRGEMFSAQGVDALRRGQLAQGLFLLRRGLAEHPNDAGSRLVLAEQMAKLHAYDLVRETVLPQLVFAPVPRPLLEVLVDEAIRVDDLATVADTGARLAAHPANPLDHLWLQLRRADALIKLQRPAEALAVLAEPAFALSGDAAELRVNALCELGRADEAIAMADALPRTHPGEPPRRLRLLARAYRTAGRTTELAATLAELIGLDPSATESRLFAIEQFARAGQDDAAQGELQALLERVSTRPGALVAIVQRLADDGAPELIQRCLDEARALGQPLEPLNGPLVFARIQAAEWTEASRAVAAMFGARPTLSARETQARALLQATIEAGRLGTGRAFRELKTALDAGRFVLPTYVRAAEGFARAQRWEGVQLFAEAGLGTYPRSTRLQRFAAEAREKLASMPKPAEADTAQAEASPANKAASRGDELARLGAPEFMAQLRGLMDREDWTAAAELISAARRSEPSWFKNVAPELDWQEAAVAFARGDRLRVVQMLGFALKWNRREVERALEFARKYRAAGQREPALLVARKVVEIVPESVPAKRFLTELEKN